MVVARLLLASLLSYRVFERSLEAWNVPRVNACVSAVGAEPTGYVRGDLHLEAHVRRLVAAQGRTLIRTWAAGACAGVDSLHGLEP